MTKESETMYSIAASLQGAFKVGSEIAYAKGGFGMDESFSNDAKALLSAQNISSHCTLVTMGSIPSIKSNEVMLSVDKFSQFDGATSMQMLANLQNANAGDKDSVDKSAEAARTGGQLLAMQNSRITPTLAALGTYQDGSNRIIDITSVMTALDDYITKALDGAIGVPINYYLKPITKSLLANMWIAKYYPGQFLNPAGDDASGSIPAGNAAAGSGTGAAAASN